MYGCTGGWFPATQVRDKCRRDGERIAGSVVNPGARAATIKLLPR
jgi:hypothetical protein